MLICRDRSIGVQGKKTTFFAASDRGKLRPRNEDCIGLVPEIRLAVIADGMGGHPAGDVASMIAVQDVCKSLLEAGADTETDPLRLLQDAFAQANRHVYEEAQSPTRHGMGTTLTAAWFAKGTIHLAHVGDSRAYLLRKGKLVQMTKDHTLAQEYVDQGLLTPPSAHRSALGHILTRAVGLHRNVDVDTTKMPVHAGDLYLLCTDGLSDVVEEDRIRNILMSYGSELKDCAERLVQAALDLGGPDNVSLVLIRPH